MMSLNDPRWGRHNDDTANNDTNHAAPPGDGNPPPHTNASNNRRPSDGPPDLDQLWNEFNQRLSAVFGAKKKGGGNNGGGGLPGGMQPSAKGAGIGAGLIALVAFLIWAASGFYIIPEGQQAVLQTFGRYDSTVRQAGFRWRMPTPIQSHQLVNVSSQREVQIGYSGNAKNKVNNEALMLTDDENIIDIQFAVQYRIRDDAAKDFVFNNRNPEDAVKQAAETAIREVVGRKTADAVLYESRADVSADTARLIQGILDRYQTGILVSNVAIQNVQPPEQVQAAFDDALRATQDRERAINEGQSYANDVIPRARGAAARLIEEAEGYSQRVVQQATGDASRFSAVLKEYARAPGVTRDRMYIDTMQQVYQNATKVLVDTRQSSPMLYLPLDQLLKQQNFDGNLNRNNSPAVLPAAPSVVTPSVENEARVRDSSRSRERESR